MAYYNNDNSNFDSNLIQTLGENIVSISSNNEYSNYHCYIYSICSLCIYKYKISFNDNSELSSLINSLINGITKEINQTTIRNLIPLASLGVNYFGVNDKDSIQEILSLIANSKYVIDNVNSLSNINAFFLTVSGKKAINIFEWLYKDATIYLERKYNKYMNLLKEIKQS